MEHLISGLVQRFERGSLSRRDLIQGLALLATSAGATPAVAQTAPVLRATSINHISVQVVDLQRSMAFYTRTFGLALNGEDKPNKIARLGMPGGRGTLVSLHQVPPTGIVDHFAINVENFNRERVTADLKQVQLTPQETLESGFHVNDPDGVHVQIM